MLEQGLPAYLRWIVDYKLLVFLAVWAILFLTVKWAKITAWSIYIFFYPATRICLAIAYLCLAIIKMQSWAILFTALNFVLSALAAWKFNFIVTVVTIVSVVVILTSRISLLVGLAVLAIFSTILILVIRRFISLFRPTRLFQIYSRIMAWLVVHGQKVFTPDPATRGVEPSQMDQAQLDKWSANLQAAVVYVEVCRFLQIKFSEYRNSGTAVAYYLANFFVLLITIVVLLGFANYGLYKMQPAWFALSDGHSYFDFLYYSFASLFFQRIPEINPSAPITKLVWMFETFMALAFGSMLFSLFFAVKRNVDDAIVQQAIADLQKQENTVGTFVRAQFSLSLDEAIDKLESVKKGVSTVINALRAASTRARN